MNQQPPAGDTLHSELGLCTDVQGIIPWPRLPVSAGDGIPVLPCCGLPHALVCWDMPVQG